MHSRQYGPRPGCSKKGKTIVQNFGDGLFVLKAVDYCCEVKWNV
jgi:hypothetical protein